MPKVEDGQIPYGIQYWPFHFKQCHLRNIGKTWFYKSGRISANYGPILKIQNLAYSGERPRPVGPTSIGARDVARDMTSRARERLWWRHE